MKISPQGDESEIFGGDAFFTAINPNNSKDISRNTPTPSRSI